MTDNTDQPGLGYLQKLQTKATHTYFESCSDLQGFCPTLSLQFAREGETGTSEGYNKKALRKPATFRISAQNFS